MLHGFSNTVISDDDDVEVGDDNDDVIAITVWFVFFCRIQVGNHYR